MCWRNSLIADSRGSRTNMFAQPIDYLRLFSYSRLKKLLCDLQRHAQSCEAH